MSLATDFSADTIANLRELAKLARQNPLGQAPAAYQGAPGRVARDINTATGLTYYDLEVPAKLTVPFTTVLSPLTPRVPGRGDVATHWRAITGVNTANLEGGVAEGMRSARITNTGTQMQANYATVGFEDDVTEEAWEAGMGLEDLRARMAVDLLYTGKVGEERMLTGGNGPTVSGGLSGVALGTCPAATLATSTSGGSIAASTAVYVGVVALSAAGLRLSKVPAGSNGNGVPRQISLTSPVAESYIYNGGSSNGSAAATITTGAGSTNSVSAYVAPQSGAVAYAWFVGGATHQYLAAITTINSAVFTSIPAAPSAPSSGYANDYQVLIADGHGDASQNALAFTGFIPLAFNNGTVVTLATGTPGTGTVLTADGGAGIEQIDQLLKAQYDATQTSPKWMLVSSQEAYSLNYLIVANNGAPLIRFPADVNGSQGVSPQMTVGRYLNKFTSDGVNPLIDIKLSPHMPAGTILFVTDSVPTPFYPGNNLGRLFELHMRREWYQQEWPPRTRAYESGVYESPTLVHYMPQTLGVITNIAPINGL